MRRNDMIKNCVIKSTVTRKPTTEQLSIRVLRCVDVVSLLRELSGVELVKLLSVRVTGGYKVVTVEIEC